MTNGVAPTPVSASGRLAPVTEQRYPFANRAELAGRLAVSKAAESDLRPTRYGVVWPRRNPTVNNNIMLQDLAALSQELNEASDSLSEQIAEAEKALNTLKLGITAWTVVSRWTSEDMYPAHEGCSLGYGKHKGKWCLLYGTWHDMWPDRETNMPLREAPREDRIKAIEKLPELVKALEKRAKEITKEARTKTTQLKETVRALRALTQ